MQGCLGGRRDFDSSRRHHLRDPTPRTRFASRPSSPSLASRRPRPSISTTSTYTPGATGGTITSSTTLLNPDGVEKESRQYVRALRAGTRLTDSAESMYLLSRDYTTDFSKDLLPMLLEATHQFSSCVVADAHSVASLPGISFLKMIPECTMTRSPRKAAAFLKAAFVPDFSHESIPCLQDFGARPVSRDAHHFGPLHTAPLRDCVTGLMMYCKVFASVPEAWDTVFGAFFRLLATDLQTDESLLDFRRRSMYPVPHLYFCMGTEVSRLMTTVATAPPSTFPGLGTGVSAVAAYFARSLSSLVIDGPYIAQIYGASRTGHKTAPTPPTKVRPVLPSKPSKPSAGKRTVTSLPSAPPAASSTTASCRNQLLAYLGALTNKGSTCLPCDRSPCPYTHRDYTRLTTAALEKAILALTPDPTRAALLLSLLKAMPVVNGVRGVHVP